ncbi:hypothetical protein cyc_04134 [Cyclospora cayetanensis]|uniref:Uncharacterized protein n=1 Tax=Cyclospora cayetanensis TaxID=88456 RepID=A0A1D3D246_9EIME|nr:hypothetical protein cyc_04134 [Cyclospora cayetanensis]
MMVMSSPDTVCPSSNGYMSPRMPQAEQILSKGCQDMEESSKCSALYAIPGSSSACVSKGCEPTLRQSCRTSFARGQKVECAGSALSVSPVKKDIQNGSASTRELHETIKTEDENLSVKEKELIGFQEIIPTTKPHNGLQQDQQQNGKLTQKDSELQKLDANAAAAAALVSRQLEQIQEMAAQAPTASSTSEEHLSLLKQQQSRIDESEKQLTEYEAHISQTAKLSLAGSKDAAAQLHTASDQLVEHIRQPSSLTRRKKPGKSGESAAKEGTVAARYAAELRKVMNQRDALVAVVKKQLKLVEVLKQQKAHLEAVMWLHIKEKEFLEVINAKGMGEFEDQQPPPQLLFQEKQEQSQQQQEQMGGMQHENGACKQSSMAEESPCVA